MSERPTNSTVDENLKSSFCLALKEEFLVYISIKELAQIFLQFSLRVCVEP